MKKLTTLLLVLVAFTASAQFGNFNQANQWNASWVKSREIWGFYK